MIFVDYIMIAVAIISMILLVFILSKAKMPAEYFGEKANKIAVRKRNLYLCSSEMFAFMHYWCILISLLTTLVVLHISCFEDTDAIDIKVRLILFSAFSLFATIIPFVINLLKISKVYRKAFCIMEEALLKQSDIADASTKCEKVIAAGFEEE